MYTYYVCACVYICISIYVHIYIHIYIYTEIQRKRSMPRLMRICTYVKKRRPLAIEHIGRVGRSHGAVGSDMDAFGLAELQEQAVHEVRVCLDLQR